MIGESNTHVQRPEQYEPEESSKWVFYERFKKDLRERCLEPDQYEIEVRRVVDELGI